MKIFSGQIPTGDLSPMWVAYILLCESDQGFIAIELLKKESTWLDVAVTI